MDPCFHKLHAVAQVMSMSEGPIDGVEFLPLDFSQRPDEHRHLDVILHKLSEDIMFRWVVLPYVGRWPLEL